MFVRRTLKELGELAVNEIGFCVGIHWRSVRGSRVPRGMISPNCRLAAVLFTGYEPAYRFHALLTRQGVERLPKHRVRLVQVSHEGQTAIGVAVTAVVSPDRRNAVGFRRAPACEQQPGYRRYFQQLARAGSPSRPWWDSELGDGFDEDRFEARGLDYAPGYAERQAGEELERVWTAWRPSTTRSSGGTARPAAARSTPRPWGASRSCSPTPGGRSSRPRRSRGATASGRASSG